MTLHLIKLCVGCDSIDDLTEWIALAHGGEAPGAASRWSTTTSPGWCPSASPNSLDGGSLYWVIKGNVQARQRLLDIRPFVDGEGIGRCRLVLEPKVVPTDWQPKRPFQGWRYLPKQGRAGGPRPRPARRPAAGILRRTRRPRPALDRQPARPPAVSLTGEIPPFLPVVDEILALFMHLCAELLQIGFDLERRVTMAAAQPAKKTAHVIVLGNEKGGSGKSTLAVHVVVALLKAGHRVASIDTDSRQLSLTRYLDNRARWARKTGAFARAAEPFLGGAGRGRAHPRRRGERVRPLHRDRRSAGRDRRFRRHRHAGQRFLPHAAQPRARRHADHAAQRQLRRPRRARPHRGRAVRRHRRQPVRPPGRGGARQAARQRAARDRLDRRAQPAGDVLQPQPAQRRRGTRACSPDGSASASPTAFPSASSSANSSRWASPPSIRSSAACSARGRPCPMSPPAPRSANWSSAWNCRRSTRRWRRRPTAAGPSCRCRPMESAQAALSVTVVDDFAFPLKKADSPRLPELDMDSRMLRDARRFQPAHVIVLGNEKGAPASRPRRCM